MQHVIIITEEEAIKLNDYENVVRRLKNTTEKLYQYQFKEWENTPPQVRQKEYKEKWCRHCRYFSDEKGFRCRISSNISKPSLTEDGLQIIHQECEKFEWD